jgi:hypothetical protein
MAGTDQLCGAEIEVAHMGEYAYYRNHSRAKQAKDYDLQVCSSVGAIHRMVHYHLPFFCRGSGAKKFTRRKQLATAIHRQNGSSLNGEVT